MTGSLSLAAFAAVQMFRYRQSSLTVAGAPKRTAKAVSCMHAGAVAVALFTPDQGTIGCGDLHRFSPVGAAANGIPLNDPIPFATVPRSCPPVTLASSTWAYAAETHALTAPSAS